MWKQGFDLALEKVNAEGGINGKKVDLKWEDSQSDPKQTVPIAQKRQAPGRPRSRDLGQEAGRSGIDCEPRAELVHLLRAPDAADGGAV